MHERSERSTRREVRHRRRHRAHCRVEQVEHRRVRRRGQIRLVLPLFDLRLAGDARRLGDVVREPRQPGIRRTPPALVEPTIERGGRQVRGIANRRPPPRWSRLANVLDGDRPVGARRQLVQPLPDVGITEERDLGRRLGALVEGAEQQPVQRRLFGRRRRHPPRHNLAAGPGHRHVQQPQVLAQLLGMVPPAPVRIPRTVGPADVEQPGAVVVVQQQEVRGVAHVPVPAERHVHDRELQALGAVDGHHLHGVGVGLQPAAALLRRVLGRPGDPPLQPLDDGRRAQPSLDGRGMQSLADVPDVGEPALAVVCREQPLGEPGRRRHHLEQRRDPALGEHVAPRPQQPAQLVGSLVACVGELPRCPPDEAGQRRGPGQPGAMRLLQRAQQGQPVTCHRREEHAAAAGQHGWDTCRSERVAHQRRVVVGPHQHRDVAGGDRAGVAIEAQPRRTVEQGDDVAG